MSDCEGKERGKGELRLRVRGEGVLGNRLPQAPR